MADQRKQTDSSTRSSDDKDKDRVHQPKKYDDLSSGEKRLWDKVINKYKPDEVYPILESIIFSDIPVEGFSGKINEEFLIRQWLKIAFRTKNDFHATVALEKIARIRGFFDRTDKREPSQVNVSFIEHRPAKMDYITANDRDTAFIKSDASDVTDPSDTTDALDTRKEDKEEEKEAGPDILES